MKLSPRRRVLHWLGYIGSFVVVLLFIGQVVGFIGAMVLGSWGWNYYVMQTPLVAVRFFVEAAVSAGLVWLATRSWRHVPDRATVGPMAGATPVTIATFGPTTAWVGKRITREGEGFILEDHGPILPADVMAYHDQGQLVWANDGTRAWVGALAQGHYAPAAVEAQSGTSDQALKTVATPSPMPPHRRRSISRRPLLIAGGALAAVVVVVVVLVLSGVIGRQADQDDAWPVKLAGTWVNTQGGSPAKIVIGELGAEASIQQDNASEGRVFYVFTRDAVADESNPLLTKTYARQVQGPTPFTGTYRWVTPNDVDLDLRVAFAGNTLTIRDTGLSMQYLLDQTGSETVELTSTYTMSPDGDTLTFDTSGRDESVVLVRQ